MYDKVLYFMSLPKYVTLDKLVGQTPLQCAELWRAHKPELMGVPLAYAGRLDPMASGKLLVLIGEECKVQDRYHSLDKQYEFSVLFGVSSDTADVLGRLTFVDTAPAVTLAQLKKTTAGLVGTIELPYPHFSSKTIQGKPLHVWTLEGRLGEITIPTKVSTIYKLQLTKLDIKSRAEIYAEASAKIETIPKVEDVRKALGNDFRRVDVRADWIQFNELGTPTDLFTIATFTCISSSGTYMRSLAEVIAKSIGTTSLAYHIHRSHIGQYQPLPLGLGFWRNRF